MADVLHSDWLVVWQQAYRFLRPRPTPEGPNMKCTIECEDCPWVDFRDYDQCGLTFNRQSPELVVVR